MIVGMCVVVFGCLGVLPLSSEGASAALVASAACVAATVVRARGPRVSIIPRRTYAAAASAVIVTFAAVGGIAAVGIVVAAPVAAVGGIAAVGIVVAASVAAVGGIAVVGVAIAAIVSLAGIFVSVVASRSAIAAAVVVIASVVGFVPSSSGFGAVARVSPFVSCVIAVAHARSLVFLFVAVGAGIVASAVAPVASVVGDVDRGAVEVVIAIAVVVAYGVVPGGAHPLQRAVEVVYGGIEAVLPVAEDIAHIHIAVLPVVTVAIRRSVHAEEVLHVDLIGPVVLIGGQIQFVGHFVREEPCPDSGFVVSQCFGRDDAQHDHDGGE